MLETGELDRDPFFELERELPPAQEGLEETKQYALPARKGPALQAASHPADIRRLVPAARHGPNLSAG